MPILGDMERFSFTPQLSRPNCTTTRTLGRGETTSGSYYAKKRADIGDAELPPFLAAKNIKPFVSSDLAATLAQPIEYRPLHGGRTAFGILADSLPADGIACRPRWLPA